MSASITSTNTNVGKIFITFGLTPLCMVIKTNLVTTGLAIKKKIGHPLSIAIINNQFFLL